MIRLLVGTLLLLSSGCCCGNRAQTDPVKWAIGNEHYILATLEMLYNESKNNYTEGDWRITQSPPSQVKVSLNGSVIRVYWENDQEYTEVTMNTFDGSFVIPVSITKEGQRKLSGKLMLTISMPQ